MARNGLKTSAPILPAGGFAETESEGRIRGAEVIELDAVIETEPYRSLRASLRDIDDLAGKIQERGQLVAVLVWLRRGRYVLLSGHRRVAALRLLGHRTVKAIVYSDRDLSEQDALDIAIQDNVDRNNFSKLELAALVERLSGQGKSQRDIARRLRISNGYVSYFQRLTSLPEDVRRAVDEELLSVRAGVRLGEENDVARARVLSAARESGPLSIGDVERLLATAAAAPERRSVAKRGSAWSREQSVHTGLVWKRQRGEELQFRFTLPAKPTKAERAALRAFLEAQLQSL